MMTFAKYLAFTPILILALVSIFFEVFANFSAVFARWMEVATRWMSRPFVIVHAWIENHE
jgi:hypothetical protein